MTTEHAKACSFFAPGVVFGPLHAAEAAGRVLNRPASGAPGL